MGSVRPARTAPEEPMSIVPAGLGRVSNMLLRQQSLAAITRTNVDLLEVQTQISSGKQVNRLSDDPVRSSAILTLNQTLNLNGQRDRNLQHASAALNVLDSTLGQATEQVQGALNLASGQIGLTSDPDTRRLMATQVDSTIQSLLNMANKDYNGLHLLGGSTPGTRPLLQTANGFRYVGQGAGLITDLGTGERIPITLGGQAALGETSARQRSLIDLNPTLTTTTALTDLRGATGEGVRTGVVNFQFTGGPVGQVNLSSAKTVGDVVNQLTAAIQAYQTANGLTVLAPGGITIAGGSLVVNVVGGAPAPTLTFTDPTGSTVGSDLGLTGITIDNANPTARDTDPKLTLQTPVSAIPGLTLPLGTIRLRQTRGDSATVRDVNLSSAATLDDVRNLIESAGAGVRVRVGEDERGLDIVNELAGPRLSVEEVGGGLTAGQLGIRTLSGATPLADFNAGRGVRIVDNASDPITGLPSPALSADFRVTLGNGQAFDVDLRPQDLANVQALLNRINQQFTAAVGQPPVNASAPALAVGDFAATLNPNTNTLVFGQAAGPAAGGALSVTKRNNSAAAEDLGLLTGSYDATSASLISQDRSGVRVDSVFTDLLDLRDALLKNDSAGITLAAERLGGSHDRLIAANALVGTYANRAEEARDRLEDQSLVTTKLRDELEKVDFAEAATRFSQLQTQLDAVLQTTARTQSRSLLDFLR
jgi:flagellin-like hook-associated protein FlgL